MTLISSENRKATAEIEALRDPSERGKDQPIPGNSDHVQAKCDRCGRLLGSQINYTGANPLCRDHLNEQRREEYQRELEKLGKNTNKSEIKGPGLRCICCGQLSDQLVRISTGYYKCPRCIAEKHSTIAPAESDSLEPKNEPTERDKTTRNLVLNAIMKTEVDPRLKNTPERLERLVTSQICQNCGKPSPSLFSIDGMKVCLDCHPEARKRNATPEPEPVPEIMTDPEPISINDESEPESELKGKPRKKGRR